MMQHSLPRDAQEAIGWSRGQGCAEVASVLSEGTPIRIEGDPRRSCIDARIDLLVARKFSSFDLVPVIVPSGVDIGSIGSVTAAVGEGPHSPFAVDVAMRIGERLSVPIEVATVHRDDSDRVSARTRLDALVEGRAGVASRLVESSSVVELIDGLDPSALVVIGAPGGSWFHRQVSGPGHKLAAAAPAGTLVVRSAPRRAFHEARPVNDAVVGLHLSAGDALKVMGHPVAAVAERGELVGIVRTSVLREVPPTVAVGHLMEDPVSVGSVEPLSSVDELRGFFDGGPVPVVDDRGRLIGLVVDPAAA
jgi:hypothetical protein